MDPTTGVVLVSLGMGHFTAIWMLLRSMTTKNQPASSVHPLQRGRTRAQRPSEVLRHIDRRAYRRELRARQGNFDSKAA